MQLSKGAGAVRPLQGEEALDIADSNDKFVFIETIFLSKVAR